MEHMTQPLTDTSFPESSPSGTFFSAKPEGLGALLSYAAAYLYIRSEWDGWMLAAVAALLILITELLHTGKKRSAESFVWLGCFILCVLSQWFHLSSVWDASQLVLFIHLFAVWWILSRSGRFLEGKSSRLLPADAWNALIRIPFSHFFLRIRCVVFHARRLLPNSAGKKKKGNLWVPLAAVLCLLLFLVSVRLLMDADTGFASLLEHVAAFFRFRVDEDILWNLLFSLPVGCWLFGLMAGSARMQEETLEKERRDIRSFLSSIQKVPEIFWVCVVALFSLLYFGFFVLQSSYLFGAFTRTLPEGFIVSQYAREGFFELCKVMAVNFTVLWLVTRMCSSGGKSIRIRFICLALLAESMLFAVIAFSKLCLYISCFGFTPLRLQSAWLICLLFAGCLLWAYTLLTDRPVFRKWMFFGAVSLTALAFV